MNQGVYPLAANMINQLNRVEITANNLANTKTTGFKQEELAEGSFNYYLDKAKSTGQSTTYVNELTNKIPKIDQKFIINDQGALIQTGNELDFALSKPETYFAILNQNNEVQYTRNGSFKVLDGFIVDGNGNNVLSAGGEALAYEDGFAGEVGVFQISSENLEKVGDNNYKLKNPQLVDQQVVAAENNDALALQGSLESSNVNAVKTMVALIEAQRGLERAQKGINSIDDLNSKVITKIGDAK